MIFQTCIFLILVICIFWNLYFVNFAYQPFFSVTLELFSRATTNPVCTILLQWWHFLQSWYYNNIMFVITSMIWADRVWARPPFCRADTEKVKSLKSDFFWPCIRDSLTIPELECKNVANLVLLTCLVPEITSCLETWIRNTKKWDFAHNNNY